MGNNKEKLMLIDGNSILNRAYYGLLNAEMLRTSDGLYTNAIFGFLNIMNMYLEEENPGYLCVAFDLAAPTFRHTEYDKYKAHRKGMPDELAVQVPIIKQVLDAMNIKRIEVEGYEADDVIGTLAAIGEEAGLEVIIITGDRDALQLAGESTRIKIPSTRRGRTETREYDRKSIKDEYGIEPGQFIDVKGLMGDASDNIPGVKGIGEKTALALVREFGSIPCIYENIDKVASRSLREKLVGNREAAFLSRKLATIDRSIQGLCNIEELRRKDIDREKLYDVFLRLEFRTFIDKYGLRDSGTQAVPSKAVKCIENVKEIEETAKLLERSREVAIIPVFEEGADNSEEITGMAFCWKEDSSVFMDFGKCGLTETVLGLLTGFFENDNIKKYGHNIKRLMTYLRRYNIGFKGLAFDSMIAAYILDSGRNSYHLYEIAETYIGKTMGSLEKAMTDRRDEVPALSAEYAETVFALREIMDRELRNNCQERLYYDIELPLTVVLSDMEYHGLKLDINALKAFSELLEQRIKVRTNEIFISAGEAFNINSPRQLGAILFEKLGLPASRKTKTGYSTNAEVLEKLRDSHDIIGKILDYRQLVKLRSTYVEGLMNVADSETGKVHSSFNQTVVVTGRISSTEPNLQNIPVKLDLGREIRKVFIPESPDYIFIDADYSQIELRVLAHISGDENMIAAFRNNEDIHTSTAATIFGLPPDMITSQMRAAAKAVNFSIIYGIGDYSLSQDLGITRKDARRYIDGYLDRYPGVKKYMSDIVEEGKRNGYVKTLFNRRRYIPELASSNHNLRAFGERAAMNTPIQGSAADIIKIAMVRVHSELKKRKMKSRLVLQVHDELLVEAYRPELDEAVEIIRRCMENAVELTVPLIVDIKTGNNWYEAK